VTLREEFPVLGRVAYMNAGTDGPVPRRAAEAAAASLREQAEGGRAGKAHFDRLLALRDGIRDHAARVMGCPPGEVALTHSCTDGMNLVLRGLRLKRGDQVLTSDEEHPGLLAPLGALAAEHGVDVRFAPFAQIADAVTSETRLIACSHVSWINGQLVDTAGLRATGVPFLLDGAQSLGAIPSKPAQLGCAFFAAAGQKWLCGPDQTGYLFVAADHVDELGAPWPGYQSLSDPQRASEIPLAEGASRFDLGWPAPHDGAWALAAFETLDEAGWDELHTAGPALAARLADMLRERGHEVAPRGHTNLVSFKAADPEGIVEKAAAAGVAVRHLPGRGLVRASVGAWNNDDDLERLLAICSS
jgi:L-cysteine/cystine lyase